MRAHAVALLAVLAVLLSGCGQLVPGQAGARNDQAQAPRERLATGPPGTEAADWLQRYWRTEFPAAFDRPWEELTTLVPVVDETTEAPCVERVQDVADQAFYCPAADAVVWDAERLMPAQNRKFGPVGPFVVLAHEVGHAVASRLGVDREQAREPQRYPTILLEAMADCYAGAALARLTAEPAPEIPTGPAERDAALLAMIGFRDPLGIDPGDENAHGNAFDRSGAFQDGWAGGVGVCAEMTIDNRVFSQRPFRTAQDYARGGDLRIGALLDAVARAAPPWFTAVAEVPGWQAPALSGRQGACEVRELAGQGPASFCVADGSVSVDAGVLDTVSGEFGDWAPGMLIAARYGLAVATARGSADGGQAALCLAGAYSWSLLDSDTGFTLSPGDLDEAVQIAMVRDWPIRDATGAAPGDTTGFDRVVTFRAGALNGPSTCLP